MCFYDEMDMIDMEIDYELNWEENTRYELNKLNEELMMKSIIKELNKIENK